MIRKFFIRDRMVMAGLVILGVLTVAAGFVSGRSTFQYALSTDAIQASTQWVQGAEERIFQQQPDRISTISEHDVEVVSPERLGEYQAKARNRSRYDLKVGRTMQDEFGLLAGIDRLFSGWITRLTRFLDSDSHVSQVTNFALLDPEGNVVLRSGGFGASQLNGLLEDRDFQAELHKSLGLYTTRMIDRFALPGQPQDEFRKALIVPLISGGDISRLYLLEIDQSSAATMSKVALVAASMMTSLLIVLGYSIPAAVAFRRIREKWKAEDQIRFLAMHDPLTGLPNRVQLQNRLEQALGRSKRRNSILSVMCIDLDRFKEVNDTLGHKTGDKLLKEAAERLRDCVRETDIVARLGGDEFAVVAEDLNEPTDAIPIARRICYGLARNFEIDGHALAISGSVGITFAPSEGDETETLLNNADLALYRAKNDGRNTFRFFEPEMDRNIQRRRLIANELRSALRNDELHVHYQPQFDLAAGELTGYEALARWTHETKGEIPPAKFIPIAEEYGLIGMLGEWVLESACEYARSWPDEPTLSVNISPAQFIAQDLAATVRNALKNSGLPPRRLLLEFTEDLLLRNAEETFQTLKELTDMGVQLALEDFGAGYSSLSYLTRLPVAKIKIDQSYIRKMENDRGAGAIVDAIIGIGKSLQLTVAAEGVETETQARYLRKVGCNEVQGFFFGRPGPRIRGHTDPAALVPGRIETPPPRNGFDPLPAGETGAVELDTEPAPLPGPDGAVEPSELSRLLPPAPDAPAREERLRGTGLNGSGEGGRNGTGEAYDGMGSEITRLRPAEDRKLVG